MKKFFLSLFFLAYFIHIAYATGYSICPVTGDYKTLAAVSAATFQPDDVITVCDDSNFDEDLTFPSSGTSGHEIIIIRSNTGTNQPIFSGGSGTKNIAITSKEHLIFSGIHLKKSATVVHNINTNGARNVTFLHMTIDANGHDGGNYHNAFDISGNARSTDNIVISQSTINCEGLIGGINFSGGTNGGTNEIVSSNTILNCKEFGIQTYTGFVDNLPFYDVLLTGNTISGTLIRNGAAGHGVNIGWHSFNHTVEKNIISTNENNGIAFDSGSHDILVKNNILVNNATQIGAAGGAGGEVYNVKIYNNTLFADGSSSPYAFFFGVTEGGHNIDIKNNLVVSKSTNNQEIYCRPEQTWTNVTSDYNLWNETLDQNGPRFLCGEASSYYFSEITNITKNPNQRDLHSKSTNAMLSASFIPMIGSQAYGAGTPLPEVTDDKNGNLRPSIPTIGAFERIPNTFRNAVLKSSAN